MKFESNASSNIDISVISSFSGENTGSGTSTSTSTGNNIYESSITSVNYTNLASCNLGNELMDEFILNEDNNEDVSIQITSTTINNVIITKPLNFDPVNTLVKGLSYNLKNLYNFLEIFINNEYAYGSNTTVDYYATYFPDISSNKLSKLFPLIDLGPNDYILYDIVVPNEKWLSEHNLFSITPYFFSYNNDGLVTDVWSSTDITLPLFDEFKTSGNKIKICITSSKIIGNEFKNKGYIISKVPVEYLNSCTFFPFIRLGRLKNNDTVNINSYVNAYYYKSDDPTPIDNYTSNEIILSFPPMLSPSNSTFYNNLNNFNNIVSYLNETICESSLTLQTFKFESNLYGVDFAINSFYKCILFNPPAQLQGNNTGENYFNSNYIDLTSTTQPYVYVLSLNQNAMQIALTSNIQIYNSTDLRPIDNGTISTSPDIPSMSSFNYPYTTTNFLPLFYLIGINVSKILSSGVENIIIVERLSYNPINFNQSSYEYTGKAYILFGDMLNQDNSNYLKDNYDISITYPYD